MCGRFFISEFDDDLDVAEMLKEMNRKYANEAIEYKTGEIFPTDIVPIITKIDNSKGMSLSKWGFSSYNNKLIINARSETLLEKPMFKNLLTSNRCLIPANGFFEWKTENNKKIKYRIEGKDNQIFFMAGLFNSVIDIKGSSILSFVIITRNANKWMREIHERMPLIFDKDEGNIWLGGQEPELKEKEMVGTVQE